MIFRQVNIGSKITALVLTLVALSVIAISFIAYTLVTDSLRQQYVTSISAINQFKKHYIGDYFAQVDATLSNLEQIIVADSVGIESIGAVPGEGDEILRSTADGNRLIDQLIKQDTRVHHVYVVTTSGRVTYASAGTDKQKGQSFYDPEGQIINKARQEKYYSGVHYQDDRAFLYIGMPLADRGDVLLARVEVDPIFEAVNDTTGLGTTGETVIGRAFKNNTVFLNPLRHQAGRVLSKKEEKGGPMLRALDKTSGTTLSTDYRGASVLASWDYLPALDWGIVTKIDNKEIEGRLNGLFVRFLVAGLIILVLASVVSLVFSRFLIDSLLSLRDTLTQLGRGVLPNKALKRGKDEIGQMGEATDQLIQSLRRTANFAHKIGEGAYDTDFTPLSGEDTLGNALLNMRDSIQNADKRDAERNWIVTGVAEVGEILRSHNNLEELGTEVIAYVANKINAIQGAFYVLDDQDKDNIQIVMRASYAYNKKKHLKANFRMAEGLVGQAAIEQDTLVRTEIPYDYVTVTSGLLGDQRPEALMIVPLVTNEQVYGVLEFAGFKRFSAQDVKFVEEISLITARTVFNIKVNERTRKLLSESQTMSNELQEQQEVLRQNAEEMQSTQEELQRTNSELANQVQEVERTQNRMASLLVNASEVITIYEEDGRIRYISPSVERIFGYETDEMIGQSDMQHIQGEGIKVFSNMFTTLIGNPKESVTVQYIYETKHAGEVWVEATGTNLISDPAVRGIIVNSRDITEKKRAEQEERMRSKMQALSENSPDLITRMNREGTFFYINPTIETYTGKEPAHFLNKNLEESGLGESIVEEWKKVLYEVGATKHKVSREIDFPSEMGDRVMNVNAIPEFDEDEKLESVLVVSHDIPDRKLIELEVQTKNRKIHDSLNYASRIQEAILPDSRIIKQVFPESFIYYKSRDTVSGDFPWFVQQGDDIFIAAVDCTGHGVPGALISLIGYFLLNDIVKSRGITDPGIILDQLDEGVTQTLRQDSEDAKTKDGMDIALCRINKNQVQYAGAHRSLYFMQQDEMIEIKGDKFPIGGGIYKNQTNFTTHTIEVKKDDGVYFCSDGFPDQFGGPDNRKFGPKRTRKLIQEQHQLPMAQVYKNFANVWENWRGDERQTDDVLMIGIKF
jgi:PAS domain S-box-containing protein